MSAVDLLALHFSPSLVGRISDDEDDPGYFGGHGTRRELAESLGSEARSRAGLMLLLGGRI